MSALVELLALEVRVPLFVAVVWVVGVFGAAIVFGRWVQRAEDARHIRRITDAVDAGGRGRVEP